MPYVDAYAAVRAFLDGDAGDLAATLTAGLPPGTVKPGAVRWSRESSGARPRDAKAPDVYVELVPRNPPAAVLVGPGIAEREVVIEATAYVRRKDKAVGDAQLDLAFAVQQLVRFRYDGVSKHPIGAGVVVAEAEEQALDDAAESQEYLRTRTRLRFVYREPLEDNSS